ncbi:hypothetical protein ACWDA7_50425 [Streptomyces sp. NPDC001156]
MGTGPIHDHQPRPPGTVTTYTGFGTSARAGPATTPGAPVTVKEEPALSAATGTV